MKAESAAHCAANCSATTDCSAFSYSARMEDCFLCRKCSEDPDRRLNSKLYTTWLKRPDAAGSDTKETTGPGVTQPDLSGPDAEQKTEPPDDSSSISAASGELNLKASVMYYEAENNPTACCRTESRTSFPTMAPGTSRCVRKCAQEWPIARPSAARKSQLLLLQRCYRKPDRRHGEATRPG